MTESGDPGHIRYRHDLERRLVDHARNLISGVTSITEASRKIAMIAYELNLAFEQPFLYFVGIDSETDQFPVGGVTQLWNPAAVAKLDAERERYEASIHSEAVEHAEEIVARFARRD